MLLEILRNTRGPTPSRVTAATEILNRAYGRPETSVAVTAQVRTMNEFTDEELLAFLASATVSPLAPSFGTSTPARAIEPAIDATPAAPPIEATALPAVLIGPDAATVRAAHEAAEATARAEAAERAEAERLATEARTARAAVHTPGAQPLKRRD